MDYIHKNVGNNVDDAERNPSISILRERPECILSRLLFLRELSDLSIRPL